MALFFSGCSLKEQTAFENLYQKEEKNIELKMEQELKRKYGQKFEITGLKRKAGIMAMDDYGYWARAAVGEDEQQFNIHSNSDGSHIEDDYAALIYNDVIEDRISAIVDQYLKKDQYKYDIVYKVTAEAYKSKDQLEDYLRETDTYIDIEITLENEKPEQAAEKIFLLVQKIYENNIHFMIRLNYNGKIIIGNDSENSVFMSLDELLDRMVEE